jgi:hypothetical protein
MVPAMNGMAERPLVDAEWRRVHKQGVEGCGPSYRMPGTTEENG